jgi:hypothetical protein
MAKTYVGQCIYCRVFPSVEDPLSDEHIFPIGLFGKGVLAKASCKKCAAITSDFEGKVLKEDMAGVRYALGFPSRRKHKRRGTKLPMEVVARDGEVKTIQVSPEDYIPILALPVFKPPAIETKIPYHGGIELVGYVSNPSKRSTKKLAAEHDAKEIAVYGLRWPEAWARMFAKIAYALAVRDYGLDRLKIDDVYALGAMGWYFTPSLTVGLLPRFTMTYRIFVMIASANSFVLALPPMSRVRTLPSSKTFSMAFSIFSAA